MQSGMGTIYTIRSIKDAYPVEANVVIGIS